MAVDYSLPKPVAGTSRATAPTETQILGDISDTIADIDTRLTAAEAGGGVPNVKKRRTSGDIVLNSTSWANVDTGLDLVINCQVGDEITVGVSALLGGAPPAVEFDVVTVAAGTPVNSFGQNGAIISTGGIFAWFVSDAAGNGLIGGQSPPYTVRAGDLTAGATTLRLRYRSHSATNRTLFAQAGLPLVVWAWNLGPAQA